MDMGGRGGPPGLAVAKKWWIPSKGSPLTHGCRPCHVENVAAAGSYVWGLALLAIAPPDEEVMNRICHEVERLLHDEVENLGKSEAELREELEARGCSPRAADKKSTDVVLYGAYPYAAGSAGYALRRVPYWWSAPNGMRLFSGQVSAEGAHALGKVSHPAAHVLSARATAGLLLRRFELYGGYEGMRIGLRSLRGPVLGLRTWF